MRRRHLRQWLVWALAVALMMTIPSVAFVGASEGAPVKLNYYTVLGNPDRDALIQELVKEAGLNVELEIINIPTEQSEMKYNAMFQAGEEVDIIETGVNPTFISNQYILPLDAYVEQWDGYDTINQSLKDLVSGYDGHVYGVPYGIYQRILFYRTDWLTEAGYDHPPATWEELIEMGKAVMDPTKNRYGYSFRGGNGVDSYYEMQVASAFTPDLIDPNTIQITKENKSIYEYPQALEATKLYQRLYTEISPPDSITWGYPEMVEAFYSGVTAFLIQDAEVIVTCQEYMEEGTWNTAPLPKGEGGYAYFPAGYGGIGIGSTCASPDMAFEVIKAICGPEGNGKFATMNGSYPVHTTMQSDPYFGTGYYEAYANAANDHTQIGYLQADPYRMTTEERDARAALGYTTEERKTLLESMLLGETTPEAVIERYIAWEGWVNTSEWVQARTY